ASRSRASQHRQHRRAAASAAGADQRQRGAGGSGAGGFGVRAAASAALPASGADRLWHRSERPAVELPTAPAGGGASQRAGDAEVVATANRGAECAAQQRGREPCTSASPARPGATQSVL